MKQLVFILGLLLLAACGNDSGSVTVPAQHWNDLDVSLETHPNPPVSGMSEMVVIITGPHGRPVHDFIVSLRGDDSMPWVQAIQDGYIGVYRRSVDLGDGPKAVLQVQLQRKGEQHVLFFPMQLKLN